MTVLTITTQNISADWDRGAVSVNVVAAAALTIGQAVYLDSSNLAHPALADSAADAQAIGIVVSAPNFYGESGIAIGQTACVCISGPVYGFGAALAGSGLVNGEFIWIDKTTAGVMNDTAPVGGAYQYVIGHAVGNDTIFVSPGLTSPASHS